MTNQVASRPEVEPGVDGDQGDEVAYDAIVIGAGQAGPGGRRGPRRRRAPGGAGRDGRGRRDLPQPRLQADQGAPGHARRWPSRRAGLRSTASTTGEVTVDFGVAIAPGARDHRRDAGLAGGLGRRHREPRADLTAPPPCRPTPTGGGTGCTVDGRTPDRARGLPQRRRPGRRAADPRTRRRRLPDRGRAARSSPSCPSTWSSSAAATSGWSSGRCSAGSARRSRCWSGPGWRPGRTRTCPSWSPTC